MFEVVTTPSGCSFGRMPHSAHEWREGFLWLKRKVCPGFERPKHRHKLRLIMYPKYPFINPDRVVLHCSGCNDWFSTDKEIFYKILLTPKPSGFNLTKDEDV